MGQTNVIREAVNHFFWTLVLQGLVFVALAILIIMYPALLFALVSATFLVIGLSLLVLAGKIRTAYQSLPKILQ